MMTDDYNPNVTLVYNDESINLLDPNKEMMALAIGMALRVGSATTTITMTMTTTTTTTTAGNAAGAAVEE
jgi:hypothetical protein